MLILKRSAIWIGVEILAFLLLTLQVSDQALVKKKISEILVSRGMNAASNLTLFPFRGPDVDREKITKTALLGIESLGPNNAPAYQLREIHRAVTNTLDPAHAFNTPLRQVATEIYRISSAFNDVDPAKFPSPVLRKTETPDWLPVTKSGR